MLQWALAYLGGALAVAHGGELLGHAFEWPEILQRALISALVAGFPLALLVAWYHGHKGLKRISEGELMLGAILLVIGAGLLVAFVHTPERHAPLTYSPGGQVQEREEPSRPEQRGMSQGTSERASAAVAPARSGGAGASGKPRVAIMPFENLSPDPQNAFFTDGLHEEILTALSTNAPGLEVVSRTTMMSFKGKPVTAEQVAMELGATHVLEGSVRRQGDHVRVTLQLIDGQTDNHLWSQDYDRTLNDALTLQTAIAAAVADQLSVAMLTAAERAKPPTSARAYDLYLKAALAYQELGGFSPPQEFQAIDALLQQALALDPGFALAHLMRANVQGVAFATNNDASEETVTLWRAELDKARSLAPEDPRVLASLAQYASQIDHDSQGALALFNRVEARGLVDPATLSQKAGLLMLMGRLDEAAEAGRRAHEVDPRSLVLALPAIQSLWLAHRAEEAWHLIVTGPSRTTPLRDTAHFYFTGELRESLVFSGMTLATQVAEQAPLETYLEFARYGPPGQLPELKSDLDRLSAVSSRVTPFQIIVPVGNIGRRPMADLRGWVDLQLGDKAGLALQGKPILDFVARSRQTPWNRWFLRMLEADARLFTGDKPAAVAAAKEAMTQMPCSLNALLCLYPEYLGARVLAWGGDGDGATALLTRLSLEPPGIAPAAVARDPLFTIPLANNPRYKALKAKLEAQMATTKLE